MTDLATALSGRGVWLALAALVVGPGLFLPGLPFAGRGMSSGSLFRRSAGGTCVRAGRW